MYKAGVVQALLDLLLPGNKRRAADSMDPQLKMALITCLSNTAVDSPTVKMALASNTGFVSEVFDFVNSEMQSRVIYIVQNLITKDTLQVLYEQGLPNVIMQLLENTSNGSEIVTLFEIIEKLIDNYKSTLLQLELEKAIRGKLEHSEFLVRGKAVQLASKLGFALANNNGSFFLLFIY